MPDATRFYKFCKLLNAHDLQKCIFDQMQEVHKGGGRQVRGGTIIDLTNIEAPKSVKNAVDGPLKCIR